MIHQDKLKHHASRSIKNRRLRKDKARIKRRKEAKNQKPFLKDTTYYYQDNWRLGSCSDIIQLELTL